MLALCYMVGHQLRFLRANAAEGGGSEKIKKISARGRVTCGTRSSFIRE